MNLRVSFCHPLRRDIIDLGSIQQENLIREFENISWSDHLSKMETAKEEDVYYSPSLEIENTDNQHGLSISAVGEPNHFEFYIFYKRPKLVKSFLGFKQKMDEGYISDKTGQTQQDVLDCLNALLRNDTEYLENKFAN